MKINELPIDDQSQCFKLMGATGINLSDDTDISIFLMAVYNKVLKAKESIRKHANSMSEAFD